MNDNFVDTGEVTITLKEATELIYLICKIPEEDRNKDIISSYQKLVCFRERLTGITLDTS